MNTKDFIAFPLQEVSDGYHHPGDSCPLVLSPLGQFWGGSSKAILYYQFPAARKAESVSKRAPRYTRTLAHAPPALPVPPPQPQSLRGEKGALSSYGKVAACTASPLGRCKRKENSSCSGGKLPARATPPSARCPALLESYLMCQRKHY